MSHSGRMGTLMYSSSSRWVSDSLWGERKVPGMCYHQKKSTVQWLTVRAGRCLGDHLIQLAPFANGEVEPRMRSRMTLIFSGPNRMLALHGGKNAHCFPGSVLFLNSSLILHLFKKVFMEHLLCACIPIRSWGKNVYVYIYMLVFSTFYNNKFHLPMNLLHSSWPQGREVHREAWIVSWSVTVVPEPLLKAGEILDTEENAALSGLLGNNFLLAWSSWISLSF